MKTVALAVLASLALSAAPVAAAAQTTTAPPPVAATPALGLAPAAVVAWLTTQGVTPGALEQDGERRFVRVQDGSLRWLLFFQSCQAEVCSDLQFSTGFANAAITPEMINGWNRDRRFLKAFYEAPAAAGEPAAAAVQYDLFVNGTPAPEQLTDYLAVWRGLLPEFARLVSGAGVAQ